MPAAVRSTQTEAWARPAPTRCTVGFHARVPKGLKQEGSLDKYHDQQHKPGRHEGDEKFGHGAKRGPPFRRAVPPTPADCMGSASIASAHARPTQMREGGIRFRTCEACSGFSATFVTEYRIAQHPKATSAAGLRPSQPPAVPPASFPTNRQSSRCGDPPSLIVRAHGAHGHSRRFRDALKALPPDNGHRSAPLKRPRCHPRLARIIIVPDAPTDKACSPALASP